MSESHPWRIIDDTDDYTRYTAAREHMRGVLIEGGLDLYQYTRQTMDSLLQRHAPGADRRPFILMNDSFCATISIAHKQASEAEEKAARDNAEISTLRSTIATMEAIKLKDQEKLTAKRSALKELQQKADALEQKAIVLAEELEEMHGKLRAAGRAEACLKQQVEDLHRQNGRLQQKAAADAALLSENKTNMKELSGQLERTKKRQAVDAKQVDDLRERVHEAERYHDLYVKRIRDIKEQHRDELKNLKATHASEIKKKERDYAKMHKAFANERDGLYDEIIKLLPPESTEFDPMQVGPRSFRREDFLARRLLKTKGKSRFDSEDDA
ncbi:hypothetical protein OC844_004276 [Tilletia horrida]|nr:hypothetical protein OC844_004276 [Tilletia horrida]